MIKFHVPIEVAVCHGPYKYCPNIRDALIKVAVRRGPYKYCPNIFDFLYSVPEFTRFVQNDVQILPKSLTSLRKNRLGHGSYKYYLLFFSKIRYVRRPRETPSGLRK